jgi:hypothetical protein
MESAQKHEPTAYETLCDKLRTLAKSEGRIMSEAEIHKSARNLMGYAELVIKINRREEKESQKKISNRSQRSA